MLNPASLYCGFLAIGVCAYLAAVYLIADARRASKPELVADFRRRALVTGVAVGAVALAGVAVLATDAPALYDGLRSQGLPVAAVSIVAGMTSLA